VRKKLNGALASMGPTVYVRINTGGSSGNFSAIFLIHWFSYFSLRAAFPRLRGSHKLPHYFSHRADECDLGFRPGTSR
jgi:hypothetical protein